MDYIKELEKIEKAINEKKMEKVRLEERAKALKKEREELEEQIAQIAPSGVDLDEWLVKEDKEIKEKIEECQSILTVK